MSIQPRGLFAAALIAACAIPAHAGLIGTTVNSSLSTQAAGSWGSGASALVDAGVEFTKIGQPNPLIELTLDIADSGFTLRYFDQQTSPQFNMGLQSFNLTGLSGVTGVSLANSTFANGIGSATFDSTSITVPVTTIITAGADWSATWNITFGAPTPEPSGALLLAVGLALALAARRRRSGA